MNNYEMPIVTIKGGATSRSITTGKGVAKVIWSQLAQVETEQMRIQFDLEIDHENSAYRIGEKFHWDLTADLAPGDFGRPELARKKTLRPLDGAAKLKTA